eukprot:IDg6034t1
MWTSKIYVDRLFSQPLNDKLCHIFVGIVTTYPRHWLAKVCGNIVDCFHHILLRLGPVAEQIHQRHTRVHFDEGGNVLKRFRGFRKRTNDICGYCMAHRRSSYTTAVRCFDHFAHHAAAASHRDVRAQCAL